MPKDEWGVKRVCPECQTRFYDLNNDPMTCPSCGFEMTVESFSSDKRTPDKSPAQPQKTEAEPILEDQEEVIDEDIEADVDDDLLEPDDDDDNVSLEEIREASGDEDES